MNPSASSNRIGNPIITLPAWGVRAISVQTMLLASAIVLLPAAAHAAGLSVRLLLPMHWPVILIGLCYGWRAGLIAGLLAPGLSFLLSGMPYPIMIPSMTVELSVYGLLAGYFRGKLALNAFLATALAIIAGRMVFVTSVVATGAAGGALLPYLQAAVLPGIVAAIAQILLLPWLASWWIKREGNRHTG